MYRITEATRTVRIPPSALGGDMAEVLSRLASEEYEGHMYEDKTFALLVRDVRQKGEGRIVHGNEAVYQDVTFEQLVFEPKINEIVEGVVVDIKKYGAFVRFGPLEGLLHVSQVMDDHVDIDEANRRLVGKESKRALSVGDKVKARIVALDLNEKVPGDSRIGLTMRQPGLGKAEWIAEDSKTKEADRWPRDRY